ncbi:MAG TPA: ferredoxin, partial [Burkholderiales bacterium]|nr:ferredoxin [Burkholderiales bacterium]
ALEGKDEKTHAQALKCERDIRSSSSSIWNGPVTLSADGELAHCDAKLPGRLVEHLWRALQERRAKALRERIDALVARLSEILAADYARSDQARSGERLRASFGGRDAGIDFGALAGLLKRALPERPMAESRRRRIASLLGALRTLDFGPFVYASCVEALAAYRARLPHLIALSKAIAAARLEAAGEYAEERHDAFFAIAGSTLLAEEGLADFPGMLVRLDGATQDPQLAEILALGAPVKVLVQFDDILSRSPVGRPGFGLRAHALAGMALGLPDVYLLQCCASQLYELRNPLLKGLEFPGAALFSVYSGAGGETELRPYLVAAAAAESRAFPAFCYDPSAESAERFSLCGNPQPEQDHAVHDLMYEDASHQRVREKIAFSFADFVACDGRYAGWFAPVPLSAAAPENVPYIVVADGKDVLHRAIVADELVGEAHRSLEFWRSLQQRVVKKAEIKPPPAEEKPAPAPAPAPAAEAPKPKGDDPYIETPKCSTCEECVKINDRMFKYDANKQAYIADPDAGTYRELVEAAESCQVAIIHPGKPRNPQEPGLEELLVRAAPFL